MNGHHTKITHSNESYLYSNPKDADAFLPACLDRTIKMRSIHPEFLNGSKKGINYVDRLNSYLVTTSGIISARVARKQ